MKIKKNCLNGLTCYFILNVFLGNLAVRAEKVQLKPDPVTIGIEYALDLPYLKFYGHSAHDMCQTLHDDPFMPIKEFEALFADGFRQKQIRGTLPKLLAITNKRYDSNDTSEGCVMVLNSRRTEELLKKYAESNVKFACFMPYLYETVNRKIEKKKIDIGKDHEGKSMIIEFPITKAIYDLKNEQALQEVWDEQLWNKRLSKIFCSTAIVPLDYIPSEILQDKERLVDKIHWIFQESNHGLFQNISVIPHGSSSLIKIYLEKYKEDLGTYKIVMAGINNISGQNYALHELYKDKLNDFPPSLCPILPIARNLEEDLNIGINHLHEMYELAQKYPDIQFHFIETINTFEETLDITPYFTQLQQKDFQLEEIRKYYYEILKLNNVHLFIGGATEERIGVIFVN